MNDILNARIKILETLKNHDCSLTQLAEEIDIPDNQLNHHLDALGKLGFIQKSEEDEAVKYQIVNESREKIDSLIEQYK